MQGKALPLLDRGKFTYIRERINREFGGNVNAAARAWGVSQSTLWRIATDPNASPTMGVMLKIADALECTLSTVVE